MEWCHAAKLRNLLGFHFFAHLPSLHYLSLYVKHNGFVYQSSKRDEKEDALHVKGGSSRQNNNRKLLAVSFSGKHEIAELQNLR